MTWTLEKSTGQFFAWNIRHFGSSEVFPPLDGIYALQQEYLGDDVAPLLSASCPGCQPSLCPDSGDTNDTWLRCC